MGLEDKINYVNFMLKKPRLEIVFDVRWEFKKFPIFQGKRDKENFNFGLTVAKKVLNYFMDGSWQELACLAVV